MDVIIIRISLSIRRFFLVLDYSVNGRDLLQKHPSGSRVRPTPWSHNILILVASSWMSYYRLHLILYSWLMTLPPSTLCSPSTLKLTPSKRYTFFLVWNYIFKINFDSTNILFIPKYMAYHRTICFQFFD